MKLHKKLEEIFNDSAMTVIQSSLIKEVVKSIGNPAGIGQGTGLGLWEGDWDVIGLRLSRLRATYNRTNENHSPALSVNKSSDKSHTAGLFPVPSGCVFGKILSHLTHIQNVVCLQEYK